MKTIKFTPKAVTGYAIEDDKGCTKPISPTFSGHVILRVPTFFERQKMRALLVSVVAQGGEVDVEGLRSASSQKVNISAVMESMSRLVESSVEFYQAIELKNLETGEEHKSFDDLSMDPAAEGMLQEIAQELAGGLKLSKNS